MPDNFIKSTTDYIFIETEIEKADIIFAPGSSYLQIPKAAAGLYKKQYADKIVVMGKQSITKKEFDLKDSYETEAEFYESVLLSEGVSQDDIIKEKESTFTYQNALYAKKVLENKKINIKKAILCCHAFHARRAYTYFMRVFPDVDFFVFPVETDGISRDNWHKSKIGIEKVIGELSRLGSQMEEYCLSMLDGKG